MRSLFAFFLIVAGLAACGGNARHADAEKGQALYLNNGQKWPVNAEMMPFIQRSGEQIDAFLATPGGRLRSARPGPEDEQREADRQLHHAGGGA